MTDKIERETLEQVLDEWAVSAGQTWYHAGASRGIETGRCVSREDLRQLVRAALAAQPADEGMHVDYGDGFDAGVDAVMAVISAKRVSLWREDNTLHVRYGSRDDAEAAFAAGKETCVHHLPLHWQHSPPLPRCRPVMSWCRLSNLLAIKYHFQHTMIEWFSFKGTYATALFHTRC